MERNKSMYDVAIIGAGGAGLLAGISAAKSGARTVLFERMKKPAKKVAISGGGRCNFTNTLEPREFVQKFGDPQIKKVGRALNVFSNRDLIELLKKYGVTGNLERNYRLYTASGRGMDVVDALVREYLAADGELRLETKVENIVPLPNATFELNLHTTKGLELLRASSTVVCTGGLSYPVTGSTGDGYRWATELGHPVSELRAALVGLTLAELWPKKLSGTAWPDAQLSLYARSSGASGKPFCVERAELLFTHFGVSGPAVLDLSNSFVRSGLQEAILQIDFFPDLQREAFEALLLQKIDEHKRRKLAGALEGLLPGKLLQTMEALLDPEGNLNLAHFTKALRLQALDFCKCNVLTVTGTRGIEYGEVTAGGIDWSQIDAQTLMSRTVPGLYFAGEILDLTGRCGGFNLQAAFSTGFLAGKSAAERASRIKPKDNDVYSHARPDPV